MFASDMFFSFNVTILLLEIVICIVVVYPSGASEKVKAISSLKKSSPAPILNVRLCFVFDLQFLFSFCGPDVISDMIQLAVCGQTIPRADSEQRCAIQPLLFSHVELCS